MSVTGIQTSSGFVPFGGGGAVLTPTGSATRGVYVDSNNALQQMTYSVEKSVPSDAVFTDTVYTPAPVSDAYAHANAYAVGDYCIYNNTLYKCIQAKAANVDAPPTNTSYWTSTTTDQNGNTVPLTVSRELTSLNSGLVNITCKKYTGTFSDNSTVASAFSNVYTKLITIGIANDMSTYGTPISVWAEGQSNIAMPANIIHAYGTHYAQAYGTPGSTSAIVYVTYCKNATEIYN